MPTCPSNAQYMRNALILGNNIMDNIVTNMTYGVYTINSEPKKHKYAATNVSPPLCNRGQYFCCMCLIWSNVRISFL